MYVLFSSVCTNAWIGSGNTLAADWACHLNPFDWTHLTVPEIG